MHFSEFATELRCKHCSRPNEAKRWPVNGDQVPFYGQLEPGNFSVGVKCHHCGKEWYVVWDSNPGLVEPLL